MPPVKVLHIIPTLNSGGAERQLVEVVSGTSKEFFSHSVCVFRESDFFAPGIIAAGQEVIDLGLQGSRPWLTAARKLSSLIDEKKPDIIHSWLYDANIAARMAKLRRRKIPLVSSLQAPDYEPEVIRAGNWPPAKVEVLRWIDKTLAALTDPYFVACSEFVGGSYRQKLGVRPARMTVIYNSVDPASLISAPGEPGGIRESLGIKKDDFVYLTVGRLDPQKDHATLLKAFSEVSQAAANAHLVMIGTGELEGFLKETASALDLTERVHFLGRRKDVGACLEMADSYVFPSLFEGLPLSLLEAMSKGLPCIASDIGPHREVIENGVSGLLAATNSAEELAHSMRKLYNEPVLRQQLGKEALKKIQEKFLSSILMPQWEELYRKLSS
jgi:glycosyltransferase involved in cell wall biosynthesis